MSIRFAALLFCLVACRATNAAHSSVLHDPAVDDGDSLTLYIVPAPCNPTEGNEETCGIDFDNPGKLLLSTAAAAKNRTMVLNPDTGVPGSSSGLGHLYERIKCGDRDVYTGQTGETDRAADYLKFGGFGLGLIFGVWPGTQQDTEHVLNGDDPASGWPGLISRFKGVGPDITFVKWKLSRKTCERLLKFHDEYRTRRYGRNYGLTLNARRGEGSGCTDMARAYVELAGVMSQEDMARNFQVEIGVARDWMGDQKGTSGPLVQVLDQGYGHPMLAGSNATPYGPIIPGRENVTLASLLAYFAPTEPLQVIRQTYVKTPGMDSWPGWASPEDPDAYTVRIGDPSFFRTWSLRLRLESWRDVNPTSPAVAAQEAIETNVLNGVSYDGYPAVPGVVLDATGVPTPEDPIWQERPASEVTSLQSDHCSASFHKEHWSDIYVRFPDILEHARRYGACDRAAFVSCIRDIHEHYSQPTGIHWKSYWDRHPEDDYTQPAVLWAEGDSLVVTAEKWYDFYLQENLLRTDPAEFTHQPGYPAERKAPWVYPPRHGMYCHDNNPNEDVPIGGDDAF